VRFTVLSDEGDRLGNVVFEGGRFVIDGLAEESIGARLAERLNEMRAAGVYDEEARLVRATLERVSADTALRFVRDPDDE
jgi:hypothetical protein